MAKRTLEWVSLMAQIFPMQLLPLQRLLLMASLKFFWNSSGRSAAAAVFSIAYSPPSQAQVADFARALPRFAVHFQLLAVFHGLRRWD